MTSRDSKGGLGKTVRPRGKPGMRYCQDEPTPAVEYRSRTPSRGGRRPRTPRLTLEDLCELLAYAERRLVHPHGKAQAAHRRAEILVETTTSRSTGGKARHHGRAWHPRFRVARVPCVPTHRRWDSIVGAFSPTVIRAAAWLNGL